MRLDIYMTEKGLTQSREKARALIMAGKVTVNGKLADKPGTDMKEGATISIAEDPVPFVSRGGLKLQKAIDTFQLHLQALTAADIGASTGGFTDCMLQHGVQKVYAIDVGYGQLDWRLRNDPRVVVMERKNARNMQPDWFEEPLGFASIDVSFISLRLMLPPLNACLQEGAYVAALIKPQFEAGRAEVGKHGVVRDAGVHLSVCTSILEYACNCGYDVRDLSYSPITGPKGNIEFLAMLQKSATPRGNILLSTPDFIKDVVAQAHQSLKR